MKVAYLVSGTPCAHCYGSDNLLSGLFTELGTANVYDWPEKDNVHLPSIAARDACAISSDACWPRKRHGFDAVAACDVAIIATHPDAPDATAIAAACSRLPRSMPIAAIDASDRVENHRNFYEAVAGRPLAAYFKREYPIGETWAKTYACPLSYPASRVGELPEKSLIAFYVATNHGGGAPGVPRTAIVSDLAAKATEAKWQVRYQAESPQILIANAAADTSPRPVIVAQLHLSQENRPTPEQYHARMAEALIGISWNGADNWDCLRHWENFAYGLCQVAETPRIQIPNVPQDGAHCFYVNTPDAVAPLVWALLHDEDTARRVARDGRAHFLKHHSSEARARYVLKTLEAVG